LLQRLRQNQGQIFLLNLQWFFLVLNLLGRFLFSARESFQAGYTTNLAVIEQQTYLVQAQTTEVIAKAAWLKAAAQLDRVLGKTLENIGILPKAHKGGSPQD
jgi:Outer membrane efflux protein